MRCRINIFVRVFASQLFVRIFHTNSIIYIQLIVKCHKTKFKYALTLQCQFPFFSLFREEDIKNFILIFNGTSNKRKLTFGHKFSYISKFWVGKMFFSSFRHVLFISKPNDTQRENVQKKKNLIHCTTMPSAVPQKQQ